MISFVLSFYFGQILLAQTQITTSVHGQVVDINSKKPIQYVNVFFAGSRKATTTDALGEFQLKTQEKFDSISFSFVGFKPYSVAIERGKDQQVNIEMGEGELKLAEITVSVGKKRHHVVDTLARYVYHKVVENKAVNRSGDLNAYKYESYDKIQVALLNPSNKFMNFFLFRPFRFVFDNVDTTGEGTVFVPGAVKESISEVYFRSQPKAVKKIIKAETISGIHNTSLYNLADYQFGEMNIYDELYVINYVSFVAPFSHIGINTYNYYLTDTQKIEGRTSYQLHFIGKVKEDLAVKGYAWIDSATWAVRSIVFKPNEKANFNFINEYTVRQDFTLLEDKYWLLKREELHSVGSIFKTKKAKRLLVTTLHLHKNFILHIPETEEVFKNPDGKIIEDGARERKKEYWDANRFDTLTRQEKEVYRIADTMRTIPAYKRYRWTAVLLTVWKADIGPISISRILNFVSKNNVEGVRLRFGLQTNPRYQQYGTTAHNFLNTVYFTGYGAYGLKDKKWQYLALSRLALPPVNDKWQMIELMYRYDMRVPGQDEEQSLLSFDNVTSFFSGGKIFSKIMRMREFKVTYEKEWLQGFSTTAWINKKTYYDIPGVFDFATDITKSPLHLPDFDVLEFVLDARYSYKDQYFSNAFYRFFQPTRYPVFNLRYTFSEADMQGWRFSYHKLFFSVKQRLSSPMGHTLYNLQLAKIFGRVPYLESYLTEGSLGVFINKFNYNMLNEFEFVSDQYVSLWVEHHFDGFFLNKIPGINKLRLREVISAKTLLGSFNKKNAEVLNTPTELSAPGPIPYIEAGVGIENIGYLMRVDVLWRLTYRNKADVSTWAIKIAIQPGF